MNKILQLTLATGLLVAFFNPVLSAEICIVNNNAIFTTSKNTINDAAELGLEAVLSSGKKKSFAQDFMDGMNLLGLLTSIRSVSKGTQVTVLSKERIFAVMFAKTVDIYYVSVPRMGNLWALKADIDCSRELNELKRELKHQQEEFAEDPSWENSFIKINKPQNIYSSSGKFLVKYRPYLGSKTLKVIPARMIQAVAYVDNNGTRFYMSKWSWRQFQKGKIPTWFIPQRQQEKLAKDSYWEDSFIKIKKPENIYSSSGNFLVKYSPYLGSKTLKVIPARMIQAVAYVDNDGTRFYMSKWSYKQFKKGKRPNWFVPQ